MGGRGAGPERLGGLGSRNLVRGFRPGRILPNLSSTTPRSPVTEEECFAKLLTEKRSRWASEVEVGYYTQYLNKTDKIHAIRLQLQPKASCTPRPYLAPGLGEYRRGTRGPRNITEEPWIPRAVRKFSPILLHTRS